MMSSHTFGLGERREPGEGRPQQRQEVRLQVPRQRRQKLQQGLQREDRLREQRLVYDLRQG